MPDVFFFTNRDLNGPAKALSSYTATTGPRLLTGIASVSAADTATLTDGVPAPVITQTGVDVLTPAALARLKQHDNIIVFIHGFANAFPDAVVRAAFNLEWFTGFGTLPGKTAVVAFSWPSDGTIVKLPGVLTSLAGLGIIIIGSLLARQLVAPIAEPYRRDETEARGAAAALLSALDRLAPVLGAVKGRTILLAHSMGNEVLAQAMARPDAPARRLFHEAVLAAADTAPNRDRPVLPWLRNLADMAGRVHLYWHSGDLALHASKIVHFEGRLGLNGEPGTFDGRLLPLRIINCSGLREDGSSVEQIAQHWYYRRQKRAGADIAQAMAGGGEPGRGVLLP